jgi:hypothetical protein
LAPASQRSTLKRAAYMPRRIMPSRSGAAFTRRADRLVAMGSSIGRGAGVLAVSSNVAKQLAAGTRRESRTAQDRDRPPPRLRRRAANRPSAAGPGTNCPGRPRPAPRDGALHAAARRISRSPRAPRRLPAAGSHACRCPADPGRGPRGGQRAAAAMRVELRGDGRAGGQAVTRGYWTTCSACWSPSRLQR